MTSKFFFVTILWFTISFVYVSDAQNTATIREIDTSLLTYPFKDPNPVPRTGKIYPYFTFDQYSLNASPKVWKMVELQNDYIRVLITPEIGGKVWGAWDRTRNKPFIYDNDVVKFRNIAMRGPWTSGGIEFNFGIIGHTPTVSTPVDYVVKKHDDGSVSCYVSALDLLTRTRWIVEISLPRDKAWFSTRVHWINSSDLEQPYYNWMNLAVPARDDLYFLDPGSHYITHGGASRLWPIDTARQRDLSQYAENNFDGSKSYHITGEHSDFFGTWYKDSNDGMIHLADRDAKPGKKVFLWAQSDAGKIWEDLLTDKAGQYVEVQSGRLINQNSMSSSLTPFKQLGFLPQTTDSWSEYWFPYHGIGTVDFVDRQAVWHFEKEERQLGINIMSLTSVSDTLKIWSKNGVEEQQFLELSPMRPVQLSFDVNPGNVQKITFGITQITPEWAVSRELNRPLNIPTDFDQSDSYARYMLGHDAARFRQYDKAEKHIRSSLSEKPFFIPALTEMAVLQFRKMNYDSAYYYARRALSINTYDPAANYYYGLSADKLGKKYDALDGWEIAALTPTWRIAAWYQIAALYFRQQNWVMSKNYLTKILEIQPSHPSAVQMMTAWNRIMGKQFDEGLALKVFNIDPDNHILTYEEYLSSGSPADRFAFQNSIKNELPSETYLELAIWYAIKLDRPKEALMLLNMAPSNNLIEYWIAWLSRSQKGLNQSLLEANDGEAIGVFPFRRETAKIMEWAIQKTDNWKPKYYLALIQAHVGKDDVATKLLMQLPDDVPFAPLYAWRSGFQEDLVKKEQDLRKARSLKPTEWRYVLNLGDFLMKNDRLDEAQTLMGSYYKDHSKNYQIGMALARIYLLDNSYKKAESILDNIHVLPYEGAQEGRVLYQAVKLNLALNALGQKQYKEAYQCVEESLLWPQNLGVGKPYDNLINTTWEDRILKMISDARNGTSIDEEKVDTLRNEISKRFFNFEEKAPF